MEVTGASCGTHAFGMTDIAVLDRRPVRGGFGPGAMERSPPTYTSALSDRWRSNGPLFRIKWTDE